VWERGGEGVIEQDVPRVSVRFKDFEIRECIGINAKSAKYELVKWSDKPLESTGRHYCWVDAFIRWNRKEPCWEFDCVGMRFIEDYEDGLCEFIQKFMEFIDPDCLGPEEDTNG
jgi:hypothetical protein